MSDYCENISSHRYEKYRSHRYRKNIVSSLGQIIYFTNIGMPHFPNVTAKHREIFPKTVHCPNAN